MYFEAGEEGGEVKLVPASEAANKVTAEPSSASGPLPGPRHGMAGSFPLEQTNNVEKFSVRYLNTLRNYENESAPSLLNLCVEQNSTSSRTKINRYCNHSSCLF